MQNTNKVDSFPTVNKQLIAVIMGPTGSGKSALALKLAQEFNGEIVSADSMQIYRGLDIGTAKPNICEQQAIRHHLINVLDISEKFDVYGFLDLAQAAINDIQSRGKLPIIAGGTGFYLRALLYGINELPGDAVLRKELDKKYDNDEGFVALKDLMQQIDPIDFERWQQHRRKLIRALEVFTLTGKPISELQTLYKLKLRYNVMAWNLCWEREALKERIALRTDKMLEQGWIPEAKEALAAGILETPTAHQVLGYREIAAFLNGEFKYDTLRQKITTKTWQYARRQLTWFKKQHPEAENITLPQAYPVLRDKFAKLFKKKS